MSTTADLSGRTAVVTGASSGIGRAIAERLGASGAHVVLGGRTEAPMKEAADHIVAAGGTAQVVTGDVRDPAAVRALVDAAVEATGRLDVMVNNAGLSHPQPIVDGDPEQWRAMLETNVLALLVGCQAAVRAMRACGSEGRIVNVSSVAAQRPDSGVYGATKHAVNTIANTLRGELVDDPIQVVTVMPGAVATNFARNFDASFVEGMVALTGAEAGSVEVRPGEQLPADVIDEVGRALPDILVRPDDIADAVLYAVSQPNRVHVAEIVVRPNRDLPL
jgi:NADP-dependent 3-hydroxy acid dehydrogenase YdfG